MRGGGETIFSFVFVQFLISIFLIIAFEKSTLK